MPVYDFECQQCSERFEQQTAPGGSASGCPACGAAETRRIWTAPAPPGRLPRGAAARDSDSRRADREGARRERLGEAAKRRARGEDPRGGG